MQSASSDEKMSDDLGANAMVNINQTIRLRIPDKKQTMGELNKQTKMGELNAITQNNRLQEMRREAKFKTYNNNVIEIKEDVSEESKDYDSSPLDHSSHRNIKLSGGANGNFDSDNLPFIHSNADTLQLPEKNDQA